MIRRDDLSIRKFSNQLDGNLCVAIHQRSSNLKATELVQKNLMMLFLASFRSSRKIFNEEF